MTNPAPYLSEDRYLALERTAEIRSEYYRGRMYAMSGGSYRHALVVRNLLIELTNQLVDRGCSATVNDVRLRFSPDRYYCYPDLIVVCGNILFADDHRDTILNPTIVIEVLSPSTERFDRGFKFAQSRSHSVSSGIRPGISKRAPRGSIPPGSGRMDHARVRGPG